jgi:hypothetical protein
MGTILRLKYMKSQYNSMFSAALAIFLLAGASLFAQNPTASGTINAALNNRNGIALVFDTDPAGASLGATGTSAVTVNFGTISAFGPLSAGITRPAVTPASFTVRTVFDVKVTQGGLNSSSYRLLANLASVAPTGLNYTIDAVALNTNQQTIQNNATYGNDIAHNLDLVVSTAAPGAGGPAVGTTLTTTINFTATAN